MDEPVLKRLKTNEEENLELNDNILSINDLPDDIKKHFTSFFSRKTLNNVMQISRHWQMITKNAYINHLRSLTAEEFNEEFAKSVFSNNYFIFNIFKEIVTTEQSWPKLVFNWRFHEGLKKIDDCRDGDGCEGKSLLYAAIENRNNNIAMYLIEQMSRTANDPEYKFEYEYEDEHKYVFEDTWAGSWINMGYGYPDDPYEVYITPLLKAILIKNKFIAKILLQKGARIPIGLKYWEMDETRVCCYSNYNPILHALEIERALINKIHIEEMEIKNKDLTEALQEIEKLKASNLEGNLQLASR